MSKSTLNSQLLRRLRALADKLAAGGVLPRGLAGEMERALAAWERALQGAPPDAASAEAATPPGRPEGSAAKGGALPRAGGGVFRIWSDGSCAPNPGAGGWGAILERNGVREELSGGAPQSTNNIMEMTAAIEALRHTPPGAQVEITTDSQYLKNGITKWIHGWKRKGWRKADGKPVLNQDLWRELDPLVSARRVRWEWIRGHTGHPENERCDELARQARISISSQ
ncbi:MAG: ribonuclease HI [SAR324 cluster bacterium]|nr:ribonuclease HI [SAR324 cluster bacterium]